MDHLGFQSVPEKLEFILGNSWITPADVQRDFQWSESHVGALLADLIGHMERLERGDPGHPAADMGSAYFMGMIIVHGADHRYKVFDGLQRLTTLTILICILRDRIEDEALKARLNACVNDPSGKPRLRLRGQTYLEDRIQPPGSSLKLASGLATGERAALRTAQSYLRDALSGHEEAFLRRMALMLLEQVVLLQLRVRSEAVANTIFRTLNMRGLRLEEADLVKARLAEFASNDAEGDGLVAQWQEIRETLTSRSLKRDDEDGDDADRNAHYDRYRGFQGFVLALEMMELHEANGRRLQATAPERIDRYVDWLKARHSTGGSLEGYLGFVQKCAENWNALNQGALGGGDSPFAPLLPVRAVRWTEWKPLVLRIMGVSAGMGRAGPAWRTAHFDAIHRACLGMALAGFDADKRALVFANAIAELKDGARPERLESLAMRWQDVQRIHDALTAPLSDHRLRRSVMLWAEYILAGEGRRFLQRVTVEHVLPTSTDLAPEWVAAFPDWRQRRAMMHLLGNLAIVPGNLNLQMGDDSFAAKRAAMLQQSEALEGYRLAAWVAEQEEWKPMQIQRRTQSLAERLWRELRVSEQSYSAYSGVRD